MIFRHSLASGWNTNRHYIHAPKIPSPIEIEKKDRDTHTQGHISHPRKRSFLQSGTTRNSADRQVAHPPEPTFGRTGATNLDPILLQHAVHDKPHDAPVILHSVRENRVREAVLAYQLVYQRFRSDPQHIEVQTAVLVGGA